MSATLNSIGLQPISHHGGGIARIAERFNATTYATGTTTKLYNPATTFYNGQPLTITAAGVIDAAPTAAAAGSNTRVFGVFHGAEWFDTQGRRAVASWFTDGQIATNTNPDVVFWIWTDPNLEFEIQADGPIPGSSVGGEFNFSATTGRTTTSGTSLPGGFGGSTTAIAASEVGSGVQGQVRVVGLGRQIDNAWGDSFTKVRVVLANYVEYVPAPNQ